ncbi:MAG: gamma carbonic anhydrase family protein, partial [Novosphingobium sp. 16-62-11]
MLAAGAMLTGGKRIGARQLWGGRPAAYMRDLTDAALVDMQRGVQHYVLNGQAHKAAVLGTTEG